MAGAAAVLPNEQLIAIVLAVIGLELLALAAAAIWRGRRAWVRHMLPGAAAGFFLTLALREVQTGGAWLALWLAGAGAAHGLDWWQRSR